MHGFQLIATLLVNCAAQLDQSYTSTLQFPFAFERGLRCTSRAAFSSPSTFLLCRQHITVNFQGIEASAPSRRDACRVMMTAFTLHCHHLEARLGLVAMRQVKNVSKCSTSICVKMGFTDNLCFHMRAATRRGREKEIKFGRLYRGDLPFKSQSSAWLKNASRLFFAGTFPEGSRLLTFAFRGAATRSDSAK